MTLRQYYTRVGLRLSCVLAFNILSQLVGWDALRWVVVSGALVCDALVVVVMVQYITGHIRNHQKEAL